MSMEGKCGTKQPELYLKAACTLHNDARADSHRTRLVARQRIFDRLIVMKPVISRLVEMYVDKNIPLIFDSTYDLLT